MAQYLATHFVSTFRALMFACLMVAILAPAHTARAIENAHEQPHSSATKQLQRLREDADQGSPLAQYLLGVMYQLGEIVPQDYAEAAAGL